ncbi:hypothetical protein [Rubritalea tangerina]|uniref:hypothetical protein n=1 Tax=Rubritalea tangerina TaxID=430798 RepID=UPI00361DDED9
MTKFDFLGQWGGEIRSCVVLDEWNRVVIDLIFTSYEVRSQDSPCRMFIFFSEFEPCSDFAICGIPAW